MAAAVFYFGIDRLIQNKRSKMMRMETALVLLLVIVELSCKG